MTLSGSAGGLGEAYRTARTAAAWEKAYDKPITARDLARIRGISPWAAVIRLRRAEAFGTVELVESEGQKPLRFRAVADAVPAYLLRRRPAHEELDEFGVAA